MVRIYSFAQDPLQLSGLGIGMFVALDSQLRRGTFRSRSAEQRGTELKQAPEPCNVLPEGHRQPEPPLLKGPGILKEKASYVSHSGTYSAALTPMHVAVL